MSRLLLVGVSAASLASPTPAFAQPPSSPRAAARAQATRTTSYDAAFFAQYAPRTALDIVQRLPGFQLDLGAGQNGGDVRGFAGTAGNVVVNGQRPSAKSEALDAFLNRIPASRVKKVEVGPGDLYGADYSSKSQVANLILAESGARGGLTGNATLTAERHFTGVVLPTADGSLTFTRGPSTFNLAGDTGRFDFTEKGTDHVYDVPTGQLIEFRRKINVTRDYSPTISGSWSLDGGPANSANLNARYRFDHFILHQRNHVFPAGGPERQDRLVEDYPTRIVEVGGDVTRPLAGGAIKLVGVATRRSRTTLDESDIGNVDHSAVVGGFQQNSRSQRNETIGRVTWTRADLAGFAFEAGGEAAWNTLDYALDLFVFDRSGARTRIDLPIDNAKVTELRGEFWVDAGRPLSKTLRADAALHYELSSLKVSGDATARRALKFLKPSLTLDWQPGGGWHNQLILRRTVAQLDFFDFISVADLASNQINGGNANLQPQRSWEARVSAEHPLLGQGKMRLELGYNLITMLQDRILTPEGFDAPGNIGTGKQMFADVTFDAPLERLWKGLRVKLHGNVQRTRVEDPVSGALRDFSGFFPRWQWDLDLRRDVGRFAYGFNMFDRARTTVFRTDLLDSRYNVGFPYTTAFIEYRPAGNRSLKLYLDDVSNSGGARDLLLFDPNRTAGQASILDHRHRNSHVRIGLTFKQSFGGGAPKE